MPQSSTGRRPLSPLLSVALPLLVVLALAAGCGQSDTLSGDDQTTDDGPPRTVAVADLTGTSWLLRFGGGPSGEVTLVEGWPITLTFDQSTIGGRAACNGYGGSYRLEGSQFSVPELDQELMGCDQPVQASEQAYLEALLDVDGINLIDDELALSGPSTELIFARQSTAPTGRVIDRTWLLQGWVQGSIEYGAAGELATLTLSSDGTLTAGTGCRSLTGNHTTTEDRVTVTDLTADGSCPDELANQDNAVVSVLEAGFTVAVDGNLLTVSGAGESGLRYRLAGEE